MSILIEGMEMPKNCEKCPCSYWTEGAHHDFCQAVGYDTEIGRQNDRPSWCHLIEVPEPHGRLIDADRLKESLDSYVMNTQCHYKLIEALVLVRNELLDKASTVIPASSGKQSAPRAAL